MVVVVVGECLCASVCIFIFFLCWGVGGAYAVVAPAPRANACMPLQVHPHYCSNRQRVYVRVHLPMVDLLVTKFSN